MATTLTLQGLLAAVALGFIAWRVRAVVFLRGAYDERLGDAIVASVRHGDLDRARQLSTGPAFAARLGHAFFAAREEGSDIGIALDEELRDLGFGLQTGLRGLRVMASFGSISALIGAGWQFLWLTSGHHGLATLVPGLPLRMATERASVAVAAGFSITFLCFAARKLLSEEQKRWMSHCRRVADGLERLADDSSADDSSAESPQETAQSPDGNLDPVAPN